MKEIQDEYKRLENHPFITPTEQIRNWMNFERDDKTDRVIIVNLNSQSLISRAEDGSKDELMQRADLLAITETWMDSSNPAKIHGFLLQAQESCINRAGGVALYSNNLFAHLVVDMSPNFTESAEHIFDIIVTRIVFPSGKTIIVTSKLLQSRQNHLVAFDKDHNIKIPMILMGDLNIAETSIPILKQNLQESFDLRPVNDPAIPTSYRLKCIDLSFSRGVQLSNFPFVSYFFDHRPVFNKIIL